MKNVNLAGLFLLAINLNACDTNVTPQPFTPNNSGEKQSVTILSSPLFKQLPLVDFSQNNNLEFELRDLNEKNKTTLDTQSIKVKPYLDSKCTQLSTAVLQYTMRKTNFEYIVEKMSYSLPNDFYIGISGDSINSFCISDAVIHMVSGIATHIEPVTILPLNARAGSSVPITFKILDQNNNPVQNEYVSMGGVLSLPSDQSGNATLQTSLPHGAGIFLTGNSSVNFMLTGMDYSTIQIYNVPMQIVPKAPTSLNYFFANADLSQQINNQSQIYFPMLIDTYGNAFSPGSYVLYTSTFLDNQCSVLSDYQFSETNLSLNSTNVRRSLGFDAVTITMATAGTYYMLFSSGIIESQCIGPIAVSN